MNVTFITGNQNKADYLAQLLGIEIAHQKVNLDEIQSTNLDEIVEHKVRQAYEIIKTPVLVEDVALGFTALHDLPGPFIKFYVEQPDGLEALCRMLDGFDDRSAVARCTYGYFDGTKVTYIHGVMQGHIAKHAAGNNGYGWDKIFIPNGYNGQTRAELGDDEYADSYRVSKAMDELKEFLVKTSR